MEGGQRRRSGNRVSAASTGSRGRDEGRDVGPWPCLRNFAADLSSPLGPRETGAHSPSKFSL